MPSVFNELRHIPTALLIKACRIDASAKTSWCNWGSYQHDFQSCWDWGIVPTVVEISCQCLWVLEWNSAKSGVWPKNGGCYSMLWDAQGNGYSMKPMKQPIEHRTTYVSGRSRGVRCVWRNSCCSYGKAVRTNEQTSKRKKMNDIEWQKYIQEWIA